MFTKTQYFDSEYMFVILYVSLQNIVWILKKNHIYFFHGKILYEYLQLIVFKKIYLQR